MERILPRPMPEDRCLVEVGWVLHACRQRWAAEYKYVETALPASVVAQALRATARAQAGENVQAEAFRARQSFGLPN